VIYDNLPQILAAARDSVDMPYPYYANERVELALKIDRVMREQATAGWKGDPDGPRGKQVQNALFPLLNRDRAATEALFELVRNQSGY